MDIFLKFSWAMGIIVMGISTAKTPIIDEGWSKWKPWDDFPHQNVQLGMSNLEYGGLMELEYICFGSVGDENNSKKSEFYWYRIANKIETIDEIDYLQIEVGGWIDNQFKSTFPVKGIRYSN